VLVFVIVGVTVGVGVTDGVGVAIEATVNIAEFVLTFDNNDCKLHL